MELALDKDVLTSRGSVHDYFAEKLEFPAYYGRNLDALYDLLCEYPNELHITILNHEAVSAALGGYGRSLIRTLEDAAEKNPKITIAF